MNTSITNRGCRAKLFIRIALAAAVAVLVGTQSGKAQNTPDNVVNGASDLTLPASYSGGAPTAPPAGSDVTFTMGTAYSPSTFTLNPPGYNLSIGTLDDLSTTPITIQNTTAGSYSTITLNGGTNSTGAAAGADILYVGSGANLTIGGGSGGTLFLNAATTGNLDIVGSATIAGTLTGAGTGTLSMTGPGTLDFSGGSLVPLISTTTTASIFTGFLAINNGTVELSNTYALEGANVTNSVTNGLTFDQAVTSHTFNVGLLGGAGNIVLQDNATIPNAVALVLTANSFGLGTTAAATTYSGVLSGAGSLTKEGSATETLSGANTYTGATTVNGGTLAVSGSLASTSLVLGGGTLTYSVASGTQAFTTTTVNQGVSAITVGATGETVNLGTVTRNADSGLDFGSTGTIDASGLTNNSGGIIGGWATQGGQSTFAVAPASPGGAVTGLATYTSSVTAGATASNYTNANIDILATDNLSGSGTITPNAIRFNSSTTYTLTLATGTNTIESGGILVTPATGSNIITGGTLTSGTQELDLTAAKNLRISSIIADNGAPVAVVINGGAAASINLNGVNTYTGGTFVNSGNFLITPGDAGTGTITLGANGSSASANLVANNTGTVTNAITVNPGGNRQFYTASTSAPTYTGLITLVGGADLAVGSEGTSTSSITIKGGVTGTGNLQIGSPTGTNVKANTTISTGAVNINGTLSDFSGMDTTAAVYVSAAVTGNTAILQDGTNQLFVFTGTNTNTGATTISSGDLQLGGTATSTSANGITIGAAGATGSLSPNSVIVDNGTFVIDRTGTVTQGTDFSSAGITGTGALALYGAGTTILNAANAYTGTTTVTTGSTLYANNTHGSATGTGAVAVQSGGTLAGSGTVSGAVTLTSSTTPSATLSSGSSQTAYATENGGNGSVNGTGTGGGLTLGSSSTPNTALSVGGGSTLSFALGSTTAGNASSTFSLANPNTNSTYLTVYSNNTGNLFANTTTSDIVSVTNLVVTSPTLSLTLDNNGAYLLIQTSGSNAGTDVDFSNLVTTGGNGVNGQVLGVSNGSGGYTPITVSMFDANNVPQNASSDYLYLENGDLLISGAVPEPGDLSLLGLSLAALAVLAVMRRRLQAAVGSRAGTVESA